MGVPDFGKARKSGASPMGAAGSGKAGGKLLPEAAEKRRGA